MAANSNKAALNIKDIVYKKRDGLWDAFDINNEPAALWAWGNGFNGELGNNAANRVSSPIQVGALNDWMKITYTADASLVIKRDGTLWGWGRNVYGQLGDGTAIDRSSPVQIGNLTTWQSMSIGDYHSAGRRT